LEPGLEKLLERILLGAGIKPNELRIEITERTFAENVDSVADILKRLRVRGFELCLDDFGTGYSSLNYLTRVPITHLKIDRSFVSRICGRDRDFSVIRSIVELGHSLTMQVTAEGVETADQLNRLIEAKVDFAQGHYFASPWRRTRWPCWRLARSP